METITPTGWAAISGIALLLSFAILHLIIESASKSRTITKLLKRNNELLEELIKKP